MYRFLAVVVAAFLAGCADDLPQVFTPYSDNDFNAWRGAGLANVSGQAFYKMPSGRLITCAGDEIMLIPATGYNLEAEQSIGMGNGFPENYNKAAFKYVRKTMCDGAGHFSFEKLPTQNWIALTHISWQERSKMMFWTKDDEGGTLYQQVMLEPGDNKVILSNQDFVADQ
jgi:hypothetical protein